MKRELNSLNKAVWKYLKMTNNSWTLPVEEDPVTGDAILTFPAELLEQAGWAEGDTLIWTDNKDGSYTLTKKEPQ